MSDILECNVSMVEDLQKEREPMGLAAVYFIQPTPESVARLIEDFEGGSSVLYPSVHIFFSSKVSAEGFGMFSLHALLHACWMYNHSCVGACDR